MSIHQFAVNVDVQPLQMACLNQRLSSRLREPQIIELSPNFLRPQFRLMKLLPASIWIAQKKTS